MAGIIPEFGGYNRAVMLSELVFESKTQKQPDIEL